MEATATAPAPQHMRALAQANRVRLARAELKRQVAEGETTVAEIVLARPWEAESMSIADLLMSQHRWGRTRCRRFLASISMVETKTIGSMTERQRNELANASERGPRAGLRPARRSASSAFGVGVGESPAMRAARRRRSRTRASRSRPRGRRDRGRRSSGTRRGRAPRCSRRRARADSRATPPARPRTSTRSAKWCVEPTPTTPSGSRGVLHEAHERAVAGAEPHVPGVGIVVGRRVVDDRQAEHVAIERDRALEVRADRRDVVQPAQPHALLIRHAAEG